MCKMSIRYLMLYNKALDVLLSSIVLEIGPFEWFKKKKNFLNQGKSRTARTLAALIIALIEVKKNKKNCYFKGTSTSPLLLIFKGEKIVPSN